MALNKVRFFDIAVNLTDPKFRGVYRDHTLHKDDLTDVIERAKRNGVQNMLITGGSLSESAEAVRLARKYGLYCTVGCHPTRCDEFLTKLATPEDYTRALDSLIEENRDVVRAVGECGLDYDRVEFCSTEIQKRFFPVHFDLAAKHRLPLFFHCRNTGDDFINIVAKHDAILRQCGGGVVHSFTGSLTELHALLALDLHISINGCSMKTADNLEVLKCIPLNRIMLETDAPWCDLRPTHASHRLRGAVPNQSLWTNFPTVRDPARYREGHLVHGRNEPCCITTVFEVLYALRSSEASDPVELADNVYQTTLRFLGLDSK